MYESEVQLLMPLWYILYWCYFVVDFFQKGKLSIWNKPVTPKGSHAIAFLYTAEQGGPTRVNVKTNEMGLNPSVTYRIVEVFHQKVLGTFGPADTFSCFVNPTGVYLVKAEPVSRKRDYWKAKWHLPAGHSHEMISIVEIDDWNQNSLVPSLHLFIYELWWNTYHMVHVYVFWVLRYVPKDAYGWQMSRDCQIWSIKPIRKSPMIFFPANMLY